MSGGNLGGGAPVGNKNATRAKRWRKALELALSRSVAAGDIDAGLAPIADKVVAMARQGDRDAIQEIGNRLDGKPAQEVTGADGEPLIVIFPRADQSVL